MRTITLIAMALMMSTACEDTYDTGADTDVDSDTRALELTVMTIDAACVPVVDVEGEVVGYSRATAVPSLDDVISVQLCELDECYEVDDYHELANISGDVVRVDCPGATWRTVVEYEVWGR